MAALLLLAAAGAAPGKVRYPVDKNHSTIGFAVSILGLAKVTGKFADFAATIVYDEQDATRSSVTVNIKMESISTGIADRDQHMRTADFFDAAQYPEITFQSSRIEKKKKGQFVAHGTFSIRGVTKELAIPFTLATRPQTDAKEPPTLGITGSITLSRREFGMNWQHSAVPGFVADEVNIEIALITRLGKRE